jgi:hypothetical protein
MGMEKSSQLTKISKSMIFQRGRWLNHQPDIDESSGEIICEYFFD